MLYCYSAGTCFGPVFGYLLFCYFVFSICQTEGRKSAIRNSKIEDLLAGENCRCSCNCELHPISGDCKRCFSRIWFWSRICGFVLVIRVHKKLGSRAAPQERRQLWPRCIEFAAGCRRSRLCSRIACQLQFSFGLSWSCISPIPKNPPAPQD